MLYYGFVLPDGTELTMNDNIRTHEELAENYIRTNNLYSDFRKSSCEDYVDFMVVEIGAIKVGNFAKATSITVSILWFYFLFISIYDIIIINFNFMGASNE